MDEEFRATLALNHISYCLTPFQVAVTSSSSSSSSSSSGAPQLADAAADSSTEPQNEMDALLELEDDVVEVVSGPAKVAQAGGVGAAAGAAAAAAAAGSAIAATVSAAFVEAADAALAARFAAEESARGAGAQNMPLILQDSAVSCVGQGGVETSTVPWLWISASGLVSLLGFVSLGPGNGSSRHDIHRPPFMHHHAFGHPGMGMGMGPFGAYVVTQLPPAGG